MTVAALVDCEGSLDDVARQELDLYRHARDRDLRGAHRLFLIESLRVTRRFLRSQWTCRSLLVDRTIWPVIQPLVESRPEPIRVLQATTDAMTEVSGYRLHGGVLALGERSYWPPGSDLLLARLPTTQRLTLLVAQGVVQVDNIGSLFRSAACFGVDGVLLDHECSDPLLRKCIRFSMGRVFDIPWAVSRDLPADLARFRERGITPVALELTADARPIAALPTNGSLAIVVGSESRGVATSVLPCCDASYAIPHAEPDDDGEARSLNVAVAAAIALAQRFTSSDAGERGTLRASCQPP